MQRETARRMREWARERMARANWRAMAVAMMEQAVDMERDAAQRVRESMGVVR